MPTTPDMSHHRDQSAQPGHLVSVVIPCYNEQQRLNTEAIATFLSERPLVHVVFVDDASTDHTFATVTEFARRFPDQVDLVRLDSNVGKAEAVRVGIQRSLIARPEFVAYWDADLSCPLSEIDRLIVSARQRPNALFFSVSRASKTRAETGRPIARFILSRIFNRTLRIFGVPLSDTQCGAKLLRPGGWLDRAVSNPFETRWLLDLELLKRLSRYSSRDHNSNGPAVVEIQTRSWRHTPGSHVTCLQVFIDVGRYVRANKGDHHPQRVGADNGHTPQPRHTLNTFGSSHH